MSFHPLGNLATSAGVRLALGGLGFAAADRTPAAAAPTACATAAWVSATSVACDVSPGTAAAHSAVVTVGLVAGTAQAVFTFDGAQSVKRVRPLGCCEVYFCLLSLSISAGGFLP